MPGKNMIEYFSPSYGKNRLVTASADETLQEIIRRQKNGEGILVVVCLENYRNLSPVLRDWKEKLREEGTLHSPKIHAYEFLPVLSSNYKVEHEVRRFVEQLKNDSLVVLNSIHQANYNSKRANRFLTELHQAVVERALPSPMILNATANGLIRLMVCDKNIRDNAIWLILDEELAKSVDEAKKADAFAARKAMEEAEAEERAAEQKNDGAEAIEPLPEEPPESPDPVFDPSGAGEVGSAAESAEAENEEPFEPAPAQESVSTDDEPPEANNPFIEPERRKQRYEDISNRSSADSASLHPEPERHADDDIPWYKRDVVLVTEELKGVVNIREEYDYNYAQMTDDERHLLYFYWDFLLSGFMFFDRTIRMTIVFDRNFSRETPWIYFNVLDVTKRKPKELWNMSGIAERMRLRFRRDAYFGKLYSFSEKMYRESFLPSNESRMAWMTFKLFIDYIYPSL